MCWVKVCLSWKGVDDETLNFGQMRVGLWDSIEKEGEVAKDGELVKKGKEVLVFLMNRVIFVN